MRPKFRFTKAGAAQISDEDDQWRDLCTLSGSAGKWTIELPSETMGPYRTRQIAALEFVDRFFTGPWQKADREILQWWHTQRHTKDLITEEIANAIYDILVDTCGANPQDRATFVHSHTEAKYLSTEFRFCGLIGFGGKFRNYSGWWVDCYNEEVNYSSMRAILHANRKLQALWIKHYGEQ